MAVRPSETLVNRCGTVSNNPISPRAGGAFNPACVFPAPATQPKPATGPIRVCGTFGTGRPVIRGGRIDSIPVSQQQTSR